jgi:hypothetical protein
MKPGAEFNPWRGACGFYPPDVVGRQKTLTDGQKRALRSAIISLLRRISKSAYVPIM